MNSLLRNTMVSVSDIPEAIDPFLFVFSWNTPSSGCRMAMRWGTGARLITRTLAV